MMMQAILQEYAGERDAAGLLHGQGRAEFISGQVYDGDWQHGRMQGHGSIWSPDGIRWTGSFVSANTISGSGVYEWKEATYEGDVLDGFRHGQGKLSVSGSAAVYEGQWQHGKRHGKGVLFYNAERTAYYEGEWDNDMKHGHGTSVYPSGNCYIGDWVEDQRQGQGTMLWATQHQRYTGQWHAGLPDGPGEHIWEQQRPAAGLQGTNHAMHVMHNRYAGMFKAGQRHGQGILFYSSGARYEGEWQCGKKHGQGVYVFEDSNMFSGQFLDDRPVLASGAMLGAASTLMTATAAAAPGGAGSRSQADQGQLGRRSSSTDGPSQTSERQHKPPQGAPSAAATTQPQTATGKAAGARSSAGAPAAKASKQRDASTKKAQQPVAADKTAASSQPMPAAAASPSKWASTAASSASAASSSLSQPANLQATCSPAAASPSSHAPPGFGPSTSVMQLYIADLLVEYEEQPTAGYKAVSNLVVLFNTELRLLYDKYSACPSPLLDACTLDLSWALQACQLWEMLRDAGLLCRHVSLQQACTMVAAAITPPPAVVRHRQQVLGPAVGQPAQGLYNPGTQLTFRDFCEVLVRLAAARYPMLHSLEAQLQQVITYHLLPLLGGAARPATAAGRGSSAATAAAAAAASSNDAVGGCEQLLRSSEVLQYLHEHAALLQQLFAAVLDRGRLEVPFVPSDSMGGSAEDEQQQQQQLDCDTAGPSAPCTAPDAAAACSAAASHVRQVLAALQFGGVLEHWQLSADAVTACLLHCSVAGVDPQGARAYIEDAASEVSYSPEHSSGGASSPQDAALAAIQALQQVLGFWLEAPVLLQDFVWGLVRLAVVLLSVHPAAAQQQVAPPSHVGRTGLTQAQQQQQGTVQRSPQLPTPALSLPQQQQQQHSPLQQSVRATQAAATGGKVPAAGGDQALQVYRELFLEGCRESQGPAAVLAALQALLEGPHGLLAAVLGWQPHQVAQAPPSGEGTPLQEQQGSCHGDELGVDTEGSATELSGVLGSEEQVTETGDDGADTDCAEESV